MADPRVVKAMDSMGDAFASTIERNRAEREAAREGESKMANETGRFAGVQSQEREDTGRPRGVSLDERKRAGAEVTRVARELGVGGKFTAPAGLDQEGLNRWQDAAIADMRKRNRSADDVLKEKRRDATTVPEGY